MKYEFVLKIGPYQMFGQLVDVYAFNKLNIFLKKLFIDLYGFLFEMNSTFKLKRDHFEFIEEFPLLLLPNIAEITGRNIKSFFLVNYQYGQNFSSPG